MTHSIQNVRSGLILGVTLAVAGMAVTTQTVLAAEKKQEISRVIAKEMTAAQKALQAGQWQEALKNLDEADQKSFSISKGSRTSSSTS
jgi:predicted small secreted protein